MLFMFVCAVASAWFGWKLDETRREQVVVAEFEKLGGGVLHHEMKGPDWLAWHFRKVQAMGLIDTQVTDAGLVHLKGLTNLEVLSLEGTQVTDAGLVHLKRLTNLRWLDLSDTQVTDAGLVHLKGLTNLGRPVHLKGNDLTNLARLSLGNTEVTDAGVEKLQQALPNCTIRTKPLQP